MVFTDKVYTKITTDKDFTSFDEKVFEINYYFKKFTISEFKYSNSKNLNFSPFLHTLHWKIKAPNEVVFVNIDDERQYFFLDSLDYLLQTYFKSMSIKLNGIIYGTESIFGDEFKYEIKDNIIIKVL